MYPPRGFSVPLVRPAPGAIPLEDARFPRTLAGLGLDVGAVARACWAGWGGGYRTDVSTQGFFRTLT